MPRSGGVTRALTGNLHGGGHALINFGLINGVNIQSHATRHQLAGPDAINIGGLSGVTADAQKSNYYKNSLLVALRRGANFINTGTVTWTLTDDPGNNRVGIEATATGLALTLVVQKNDAAVGSQPAINFRDGGGITWGVVDDGGSNRVNISGTISYPIPFINFLKAAVLVGSRPTLNWTDTPTVKVTAARANSGL
ncbi:unnamed protein product, partial [marine sediment metagenome]